MKLTRLGAAQLLAGVGIAIAVTIAPAAAAATGGLHTDTPSQPQPAPAQPAPAQRQAPSGPVTRPTQQQHDPNKTRSIPGPSAPFAPAQTRQS